MKLRTLFVGAVVEQVAGADGVPLTYAEGSPPRRAHRSAVVPRAALCVPSVLVVSAREVGVRDTLIDATKAVFRGINSHYHYFRRRGRRR